jgi:hypothetical protein
MPTNYHRAAPCAHLCHTIVTYRTVSCVQKKSCKWGQPLIGLGITPYPSSSLTSWPQGHKHQLMTQAVVPSTLLQRKGRAPFSTGRMLYLLYLVPFHWQLLSPKWSSLTSSVLISLSLEVTVNVADLLVIDMSVPDTYRPPQPVITPSECPGGTSSATGDTCTSL